MSELKIKGIWLSKEILDIPELSIKEKNDFSTIN